MSKSVSVTNETSGDLTLSQIDIDNYATTYAPDPYTACAITVTDNGVTLDAQS